MLKVSPSGSLSFESTETVTAVSSLVTAESDAAVGESLTNAIVTETTAVFESVFPSFALNVKESIPLAFAIGTYSKSPVEESIIVARPLEPLLTME